MRLIAALKRVAKRHWPALSLRTILFGTLLFVAALPGVGAVFLRVYENTLVQQTEAELVAQGAVLASAARVDWGGHAPSAPAARQPEPPRIDLRTDPVLPIARAAPARAGADPRAVQAGRALAPIIADAAAITRADTYLLDAHGIVVAGTGALGGSYSALPEVRRALAGVRATALRARGDDSGGIVAWLSRAAAIRVHHVRPIMVDGRVVGAVMLSRAPRGLFLGIYQDRGKIALGIALILAMLVILAGVLSRGIARPIRALATASDDVARGGTHIPDPPATAAIEIRELYANFAAMAARIEQRTRYLRDFAIAMSHEFKTPLTGIRGAIELIGDHGADMDEDRRRRFLDNALADADRLSHLVERLLDLARADLASVDDDARCDIVAVAAALAGRAAPPTVGVTAASPIVARVSAETLRAVLTTLIDNARQAGATSVDIAIAAMATTAVMTVTDDGEGIAERDRARVFDAFFTARRAQGGTGFGLPIARSLLSVTGATIAVADRPGPTCFEITVALA